MTATPPTPAAQPLSPSDERLWASLAHFGNILGLLPSLLIFLILGPRSPRVREESRESLNFVITTAIVIVGLVIVSFIVSAIYNSLPSGIDLVFSLLGLLIGFVQFGVWVAYVVLSIVAGVRVNQGGSFRYPISLRLIK